jgi:hypothetical protein
MHGDGDDDDDGDGGRQGHASHAMLRRLCLHAPSTSSLVCPTLKNMPKGSCLLGCQQSLIKWTYMLSATHDLKYRSVLQCRSRGLPEPAPALTVHDCRLASSDRHVDGETRVTASLPNTDHYQCSLLASIEAEPMMRFACLMCLNLCCGCSVASFLANPLSCFCQSLYS